MRRVALSVYEARCVFESVRVCLSLSLCLYLWLSVSMCGTQSSIRIIGISASCAVCVNSLCVLARCLRFCVCVGSLCVSLSSCLCERECDRLVRRPVHRFTPLDVVTGVCWLPIFHLASQSRIIFRKLRIIFRTCNFSELT